MQPFEAVARSQSRRNLLERSRMRLHIPPLAAAAVVGALAVLVAPRGALGFAPLSARTGTCCCCSPAPATHAYVQHPMPSSPTSTTSTSLNVFGPRKEQTEREVLELKKHIRSLEGTIRKEEEYNTLVSLVTGLVTAAAVFFVVDGNACPACAEAFPDTYQALQDSDLVLAARSSLPPIVADLIYDLGDAFEYLGQAVGKIFELLYMVVMAVLPILGKAAIAAFNAAIPAIQKGLEAFLSYVGQAASDSTVAVQPYIGEAQEAAKPYLNEVGKTASDVATSAGSAVSTKVAPIVTQVEGIKSAADSVATSISGKVTSAAANVPVPSAATVEQVKEVAKSAAESVNNAVEAAKTSVEASGAIASASAPPTPAVSEPSVVEAAKSAAESVTNAVESAKATVEASSTSGATSSTPPAEPPAIDVAQQAKLSSESIATVAETAKPPVEASSAINTAAADAPAVETPVASIAEPVVEKVVEPAKDVAPPTPPPPSLSAVSKEVSSVS